MCPSRVKNMVEAGTKFLHFTASTFWPTAFTSIIKMLRQDVTLLNCWIMAFCRLFSSFEIFNTFFLGYHVTAWQLVAMVTQGGSYLLMHHFIIAFFPTDFFLPAWTKYRYFFVQTKILLSARQCIWQKYIPTPSRVKRLLDLKREKYNSSPDEQSCITVQCQMGYTFDFEGTECCKSKQMGVKENSNSWWSKTSLVYQ